MCVEPKYSQDMAAILSHRYDQGADLWTTPDKRIIKGAPFSTLECMDYLTELGMPASEPVLQQAAALFFDAWQPDGRFKVYPKGAIMPCHTILALNGLCKLGYANDVRLQTTFQHLLATRHTDGGWRCEKYYFGKGPETACSNPHPTLMALNALRYGGYADTQPSLDSAVEFLLQHWVIKQPIGPCHYGIGTLFMQAEYPFRNYNLFVYVHTLSFYKKAHNDPRFLQALAALQGKLQNGQMMVERVVPKLAKLNFCKKGEPSTLATKRYHEILQNLGCNICT